MTAAAVGVPALEVTPEQQERIQAAFAELARAFNEIGRAIKAALTGLADLFRRLVPVWRRALEHARWVNEARRVRLRMVHVDYRRRLLCRRRRAR